MGKSHEVDPFAFVNHVLSSPEAMEAEGPAGRKFGLSSSAAFPLTQAARTEGRLREAAAQRTPAAAPEPARKPTREEYQAKLEAKLRDNPEHAQMIYDAAAKALFGASAATATYEADPDEHWSLGELLEDAEGDEY